MGMRFYNCLNTRLFYGANMGIHFFAKIYFICNFAIKILSKNYII